MYIQCIHFKDITNSYDMCIDCMMGQRTQPEQDQHLLQPVNMQISVSFAYINDLASGDLKYNII